MTDSENPFDVLRTWAARIEPGFHDPIQHFLKDDPDFEKLKGLAEVVDRNIARGADYEKCSADLEILRGIQKKNSERNDYADKLQGAVDRHFGKTKPDTGPDNLSPETVDGPKKPQLSGGAAAFINSDEGRGRNS